MAYEIETGVPAPDNTGHRSIKYPYLKMKVGDSFVVHDKPTARVQNTTYNAGKRYGMKFTCRTIADNTTRVWRIA